MASSTSKRLPAKTTVAQFIAAQKDAAMRKDCRAIIALLKRATGEKPRTWGPNIVGFGSYYHYYGSSNVAEWPLAGFAPRKRLLVIYLMFGFEKYAALTKNLGKHTTGNSCLHIKSLKNIDMKVLERLISVSYKKAKQIMKKNSRA